MESIHYKSLITFTKNLSHEPNVYFAHKNAMQFTEAVLTADDLESSKQDFHPVFYKPGEYVRHCLHVSAVQGARLYQQN